MKTKNSHLREIKDSAFSQCSSLEEVNFPSSLQIIGLSAFSFCSSLETVTFPEDSQLEMIQDSFNFSKVKNLSIPKSVRKISYMSNGLEYVYINNDLFESNEDGTAIFSKDGKDLIFVVNSLKHFEIPSCVKVITEFSFYSAKIRGPLIIPASVEVIESKAFTCCCHLKSIVFEDGSQLNFIGEESLPDNLKEFIINNENFHMNEDGSVTNLDTNQIIFRPNDEDDLLATYYEEDKSDTYEEEEEEEESMFSSG